MNTDTPFDRSFQERPTVFELAGVPVSAGEPSTPPRKQRARPTQHRPRNNHFRNDAAPL
jgi:hypothetical protein